LSLLPGLPYSAWFAKAARGRRLNRRRLRVSRASKYPGTGENFYGLLLERVNPEEPQLPGAHVTFFTTFLPAPVSCRAA